MHNPLHAPPEKGSLSAPPPGAVEDYTRPFLYTFCAWVFCALTLVWALWGFLLAILISVAANHVITAGAARKAAREAVRPSTAPLPPR
jgi:hypothetical protein